MIDYCVTVCRFPFTATKLTASDKKQLYYAVGPLMVLGVLLLLAGFSGMMATCDTGCCAGCNLFFHKVRCRKTTTHISVCTCIRARQGLLHILSLVLVQRQVFLVLAVLLQCAIYIYIAVLKKKVNDRTGCLHNLEDEIKKVGERKPCTYIHVYISHTYICFVW